MKESTAVALEYLKSNAGMLDLPDDFSDKWNIHVHIPEGAIQGWSVVGYNGNINRFSIYSEKSQKYLAMTGK